jgi:hypothetical protein
MKQLFTFLAVLFTFSSFSQIFHKRYAYASEIMYNMSSTVIGNRIYNVSSSNMFQGAFTVQKTDLTGNIIITRMILFGTSTPVVTVRKVIASGNKLYVVGSVRPGSTSDAFLVVLDSTLNTPITYAMSYGTSANNEEFFDILQASNTDLVMVGHSTVPTSTVGVFRYLPFVARAAVATGTPVYQKIFDDGSSSKLCYSVAEDAVNNSLFISGGMQSTNSTHIFKISDDALGIMITARNMYFSASSMNVKSLQVYGNKIFMIGSDPGNNLMTVETDNTLNLIITPKYYTNFKYHDHVKVGSSNYISGLTVPTGTYSYLSSLKMDSIFNYQSGMTYSLVPIPMFTNLQYANVVNKSNTMYWIAMEGWTAPAPYTNRYIVASDMALNAVCHTPMTLITGTNVNTIGLSNMVSTGGPFTTATYTPFPNAWSYTITTLCSPTGIENVNEQFEHFVIKNAYDKVIVESPYSEYSISLFDISGKIILTKNANSNEEVNTSSLAAGIYVLKLNANGYEQRQKIIKQ